MTLIKSISGIRGTIGGKQGDNLTPIDAVKFACSYGQWLKNNSKNIIFINHDWKDEWLFPEMDFIISNPPYVNKQEINKDEDGIWFEPENALFSSDNGFFDVELIIKKSYFFLKTGGKLFLEHAPNQKVSIEKLIDSLNFDSIEFIKDLNETIRFSILKK